MDKEKWEKKKDTCPMRHWHPKQGITNLCALNFACKTSVRVLQGPYSVLSCTYKNCMFMYFFGEENGKNI
jgi:hypothetical protein